LHYERWRKHGDPLYVAPVKQESFCDPGEECGHPVVAKGFCRKHYDRWKKHGDPLYVPKIEIKACAVEDCDRVSRTKGFCTKHYQTFWKHGDPLYQGSNRKYSLDEEFFDEITDEKHAYWLGFFAADGNVNTESEIREHKDYVVSMELATKDSDHLIMLRDHLGSDAPIKGPRKGCMRIEFNSKKLRESLISLGIVPRKSGVVEPWNGPGHLMPAYWRGLFDGDGCISRIFRGEWQGWHLDLSGSKPCVEEFALWAKSVCGSEAHARNVVNHTWRWVTAGTRMPQMLAEALFEDATVYLLRKKKLADELCSLDYSGRWHK